MSSERQITAVFDIMRDGEWRTLKEIQRELSRRGMEATDSAISARLRDFRKPEFGSHIVETKGKGKNYSYSLVSEVQTTERKLSEISIGKRYRKDLGDLSELSASIKKVGLLHPIVITTENKLVVGARRLAAFRQLGRDTIPVHIVRNLTDVLMLQSEQDENTCRMDFKDSEAIALGRALESMVKPKAEQRKGGRPKTGEKFTPVSEPKTRDKVGKAIGMSGVSYERGKAIVEAAESDPETFGDLVEEMDRTGKIQPVYEKLLHRQNGPTPEATNGHAKRLPVGVEYGNQAVNCLKRIPKNDPLRKRGFQIVADWMKQNP
jgi:ParB/RepB/Spo0J family partition protein